MTGPYDQDHDDGPEWGPTRAEVIVMFMFSILAMIGVAFAVAAVLRVL